MGKHPPLVVLSLAKRRTAVPKTALFRKMCVRMIAIPFFLCTFATEMFI
jgi:hypothetical protein